MATFIETLQNKIQGDVLTDELSLGLYSTDASVYQIRPHAVVCPKDAEDVQKALSIAAQYQVSILPRGGGTSLAGQTVGESLVLDFSRYMNQILEFNEVEKWIRVQPGMVRDELNAFLAEYNLHFAPDPATSSRANVGGMVGNNSSGTKSILYGKTIDHVLEAQIILADGSVLNLKSCSPEEYHQKTTQNDREGEIYRGIQALVQVNQEEIQARFPKVMRRVGGYNLDELVNGSQWNLCKIITGSEGTLATTLELKLNLEKLPAHKSVCVVHFRELGEAIRAVVPMLAFHPAAIEILDETVVGLSRENLTTQRACHFIEGDPKAILIVEFYGDSAEEVMHRPQEMIALLQQKGMGYAYPLFPEGSDYEDVWLIRKKGLGLMLGIKGDKKPLAFIEDAGIPTEVLPEYITKVLEICARHQTQAAMYAHASVGVIHVRPILDLRQQIDIDRFKAIAEETFELVRHYGGSWSGEHGDGLVRSPFNEAFFGPQLYDAFKQLKALFDPENRMNPGKIVDAPPMDQNLRYGADYQDKSVKTHFQYRQDGSFEAAVHMCTGVGECRKMLGGTMCPSFKATRREADSTRGRANALRLAISGQYEEKGLATEGLQDVLDLCLSCKACKSECPSNVDMARLKSEVRQQYFDAHGLNWRDRLVRDTAAMARRLSGLWAPLINRLMKGWLFRKSLDLLAGFHAARILPAYSRQSFEAWFSKQAQSSNPNRPRVALFADTYLNFHEPQIGRAAVTLLQDCGYQVELVAVGCCQRPRISHGLLTDAKRDGHALAQALDKWLQAGVPILICEPSCASALIDDLPDLLLDDALAQRMQSGIYMIDQFLAEEINSGRLKVQFETLYPDVLLHGHCHQKALFGTQFMHEIWAGIDGIQYEEIPSGCCGMAGSFGYEKEHYALSEKIGKQVLFPAIAASPASSQLLACGVSCRHQIAHFTQRKALHWVESIRVKQTDSKA